MWQDLGAGNILEKLNLFHKENSENKQIKDKHNKKVTKIQKPNVHSFTKHINVSL